MLCPCWSNAALDLAMVDAEMLIVTGDEDKEVSPPEMYQGIVGKMKKCRGVQVLEKMGHWHTF